MHIFWLYQPVARSVFLVLVMASTRNIIIGPPEIKGPLHLTYSEYLFGRLQCGGDNVAQIYSITGAKTTYGEILQRSVNLAEGLRKLGVKKGDIIALSCENRFEFTICIIAVMFAGAVIATINTMYTRDELLHMLNMSKPKMVFCSSFTIQNIKDIQSSIPSIQVLIAIDVDRTDRNVLLYNDLVKTHVNVSTYKVVEVDIHDPMSILGSSGTTGMSKGVVLTHHNYSIANGNFKFLLETIKPISQQFLLSVMPWFHMYGFMTHLFALNYHLKYAFLRKFDPVPFLKGIQDYKVSLLFTAPPLMVFLAKDPLVDNYDLSSVTDIWCGAAPLSKELELAVMKRIGVKRIQQMYGLTESTALITHSSMEKVAKPGSCGKCLPGIQIKVIDLRTHEALGPNKDGEICVKGPIVMAGYLGDTHSTKLSIDSEGWLHTGDVGYYDEEQCFYIVDRLKELIKFKGFQVPPAELEAILLQNPQIKDCGVIGLPEEKAGELPLAFVVLQPGSKLTEHQIKEFVASKVSYHKRLHGGVIFVNEIKKNPSGKILRKELRTLLRSAKKSKI